MSEDNLTQEQLEALVKTNQEAFGADPVIAFADNTPDLVNPELAAQLNPDGELQPADIEKLQRLISRLPQGPKERPIKFWFEGNLISREEHDKLSWEAIHASNNVVSKRVKKVG